MIIASGIIGGYSARGVTFSGDYLKISGSAGLSDSKTGLFSIWTKSTSSSLMFAVYDGRFRVYVDTDLSIVGMNSSGSTILNISAATSTLNNDNWHHTLAAWDTSASAKTKVYLDGVDATSISALLDSAVDYGNYGEFRIGAATSSASYSGDMAEFYLTNEWTDITDAAVRAKFSRNGRPVSLGSDGSKPTGTAPPIYLKGPASTWGVNSGTGGNFTVVGSFSDAATKPSY